MARENQSSGRGFAGMDPSVNVRSLRGEDVLRIRVATLTSGTLKKPRRWAHAAAGLPATKLGANATMKMTIEGRETAVAALPEWPRPST